MYQISTLYCAWPEKLIMFEFQPSQEIRVKWGAQAEDRGRGVNSVVVEKPTYPILSLLLGMEALEKFLVVGWGSGTDQF